MCVCVYIHTYVVYSVDPLRNGPLNDGFRKYRTKSFVSEILARRRICEICKNTDTDLINYHLFTFTARLIIFVHYVYTLMLFIQYCITVLAIFWAIFTHSLEVADNRHRLTTHSPCQSVHKKGYSVRAHALARIRRCEADGAVRCLCKQMRLLHLTAAYKLVSLK